MEWGKCPFGIFSATGKCDTDACLFSVTDDELVYTFGIGIEVR